MGRHKNDDSTQIFDVSKPGRSAPSHNSRPVIVNHRQISNDPMVTGETNESELMNHSKPVIPIAVSAHNEEHENDTEKDGAPVQSDNFFGNSPETAAGEQSSYQAAESTEQAPPSVEPFSGSGGDPSSAHPSTEPQNDQPAGTQSSFEGQPLPVELTAPKTDDPVGLSSQDSPAAMFPQAANASSESQPAPAGTNDTPGTQPSSSLGGQEPLKNTEALPTVPDNIGEIEALPFPAHAHHSHFTPEPRQRKWVLPSLVLLLVGTFLIFDAGIIGSGNLPFQIFKEKQETSADKLPVPTPQPAATSVETAAPETASAVPAGSSEYSLAGSPLSFTYPTAWGKPAVTADSGFTKRGGNNKSVGIYTYLVSFETNKDIELALTSNKYLPASRTAQYFDYLQWCTGTHDSKIYRQKLLYSTTSGVDTPGTITCSDGPVADAAKVDELTIVQKNTKDSAGKTLGDIYTKNLTDREFVVLRVKDAAMSHSEAVKTLLSSVKMAASANSAN